MIIYGICSKCGKSKWFIRHRRYLVPKVSRKPITTADEMCGKCARNLKKLIKRT